MKITARAFKEALKDTIKNNKDKTSYGKIELITLIEETYSDFLEMYLED